jgi:hypothetical protein
LTQQQSKKMKKKSGLKILTAKMAATGEQDRKAKTSGGSTFETPNKNRKKNEPIQGGHHSPSLF